MDAVVERIDLDAQENRKDRNILHDAVKTDADIIVSSDKKFKRYADGYEGIAIMKPSDYVSSREDNKNNKRQKK